jgi:hypothetical protein
MYLGHSNKEKEIKNYDQDFQDLWDAINLQIMRIEEKEEVQVEDTENTFNKTIS